jgi:uncharacterized membrane protein YbaN (DUF454 family)
VSAKADGAELRSRSRLVRLLYLAVGLVSLAVGVAGIVLPLVPTTPLVLLAAYCFARSSRRLHGWLIGHPRFGRYVSDFESGRGIPRRVKLTAIVLASLAFGFGFYVVSGNAVAVVALAIVAATAMAVVLRVPTYEPSE